MKRFLNLLGIVLALSIVATSCEKAPFLTLSTPKTISFTDQGGTQSITFTANRDWSVSSSDSWCKVSPSSGNKADGNITVTLTCEQNTTYDPRSATLTVRVEELSETITVTQDTNLGLLVSPTSYDLTNAAQSIEVEVRTNVKYSVEIDAACKDWITQTGTKALSTEKITFSIAANESYDNREGKITIKQTDGSLSETIVVKQSQTNGLFITTPEYDLSNEAHTLTVDVQANIDYEVSSDVDWIANTKATTKGLVNSQITLQVNANETYDDREGHVTVKQKGGELSGVITIRQDENYGIFVSKESVDITSAAQSVEVEVKYNVDFDVIIPSESQGIMITTVEYYEGSGNTKALSTRKYRFGITDNTSFNPRETTITFKEKNGSMCGTFRISQDANYGIFVEPSAIEIDYKEQSFSISISSNVDYDIVIPENANSWLKKDEASQTKGLVSDSFSFSVTQNESYYSRDAIITFKSNNEELNQIVTIKQGPTPYIDIPQKEFNVQCDYTEFLLTITTNNGYVVSFNDDIDWVLVDEASVITQDKDIITYEQRVIVLDNENASERETALFIRNDVDEAIPIEVSIKQDLQPAIVFADSATKEICVAAFDTSGDGEVTYKEAARVTGISSLTIGKEVVKSFDEFQYFTNVKTIPQGMFEGWILESIILPNSIEKIGKYAFKGCSSLAHIELQEGIRVLGDGAFYECTSLKTISLPDSISSIESNQWTTEGVFWGCTNLESVKLPNSLTRISNRMFEECASLKSINIPESVVSVGYYTFFKCISLTEAILPDTLSEIGACMFYMCSSLKKVNIPTSLTKLDGMFNCCTSLEEITIPESITIIGDNTFNTCSSLKQIVVPKNVVTIATFAFLRCTSLETVIIMPETVPSAGLGIFNQSGDCPIQVPASKLEEYRTAEGWSQYSDRMVGF